MWERFEVWFGAIFGVIGAIALVVSAVLYVTLRRSERFWPFRCAVLAAPLIIGIVFTSIGVGFSGYGIMQYRTEQRILETGTLVRATVVNVEETFTRVNGRYLWRVHYQYQTASGATHSGASRLISREDALSWRAGEQAFIRYDPQQPAASVWLGRTERG
jgi:hypothetical protein